MRQILALTVLIGLLTFALLGTSEPQKASAAGIAEVSVGGNHTCALTTAGGVKCWGSNSVGQLGGTAHGVCLFAGLFPCTATPIDVAGLSSGVASISAGGSHTCALTDAGGVLCWGYNGNGELGDGTTTNRSTPVQVVGLTSGVTAIDTGRGHTCAYGTNGLACWGSDFYGQLGVPTSELCQFDLPCSSVPVDLGSGAVDSFDVGGEHSCYITSGVLRCWGRNSHGQVGDGTTTNRPSPTPVSVPLNSDVVMVSAGLSHTCAVKTNGEVHCWGSDADEQLGAVAPDTCGATPCAMDPIDVVGLTSGYTAVAAGHVSSCALTTTADIKCWGANGFGEVGNGTTDPAPTPVDICRVVPALPMPFCTTTVLPDYTHVSVGGATACARTAPNNMECRGWNEFGQLGNGLFIDRDNPGSVFGFGTGSDSDGDGCTNAKEQQTAAGSQATGGRRDPKSFWDFFDTPASGNVRDRIVSTGDVLRVVQRFGTNGSASGHPLLAPPASGYHVAFDRTPPPPGGEPWDVRPPDGIISTGDILLSVAQFGHTCV